MSKVPLWRYPCTVTGVGFQQRSLFPCRVQALVLRSNFVSLNVRLEGLLGPVFRVIRKKKKPCTGYWSARVRIGRHVSAVVCTGPEWSEWVRNCLRTPTHEDLHRE